MMGVTYIALILSSIIGVSLCYKDSSICDDGETNLSMDFNGNPTNYLCYEKADSNEKRLELPPLLQVEHIPADYKDESYCTNTSLFYGPTIPTFGPHRFLWAKYGEYSYLPKQRWLHNLVNGAIVLLYHPCAPPEQLQILKSLLKTCLKKHVITPFKYLYFERPFALVSHGHRLLLSSMNPADKFAALTFIKQRANQAPQNTDIEGRFKQMLVEAAGTPNVQKCSQLKSDILQSI